MSEQPPILQICSISLIPKRHTRSNAPQTRPIREPMKHSLRSLP